MLINFEFYYYRICLKFSVFIPESVQARACRICIRLCITNYLSPILSIMFFFAIVSGMTSNQVIIISLITIRLYGEISQIRFISQGFSNKSGSMLKWNKTSCVEIPINKIVVVIHNNIIIM